MGAALTIAAVMLLAEPASAAGLVRSAQCGPWSAPATWEGGRVPGAQARVQVRAGHRVAYDVASDTVIRSIHVAGTLSFAPDRTTRLNVGLIRIQAGDSADEEGFACTAHMPEANPNGPRPALEVGTPAAPIEAACSATIRLVAIDGMDPESCPALVCCGGRMLFHGAPMSHTWVKLGQTASAGAMQVELAEPVSGWRVGDHILITATQRSRRETGTLRPGPEAQPRFTEERTIAAIAGTTVFLDRPLEHAHLGSGEHRAEVANLSRNVVVESASPEIGRGHTMYHRGSEGSIGYAEFRHLGKEGVLGRYSLHFHLVGDTMRGAYVQGASIWDSGNRWITIHGTNHLIVRDCVGYQAVGHGFYLEDGTEAYNVLDHNLAVQAFAGKALPNQVLAFDRNEGAGFWWANSLNSFTRNVACECDRYGFRYEATPGEGGSLRLPVLQPDGRRQPVEIRSLPFVRFDDDEAHSQLYGVNLGEGVGGVGPDIHHPFLLRNTRLWDCQWAFRPGTPSVLVDRMEIWNARYGIYQPALEHQAYRGLKIMRTFLAGAPTAGDDPEGLAFPRPLEPCDDLPPSTVITRVERPAPGKLRVIGTCSDNGTITRVLVNGREASALAPNFAEWEWTGKAAAALQAHAEDAAGNVEQRPHIVPVR